MNHHAYTSTAVAPAQVAAGAVIAVALITVNVLIGAPLWIAVPGALLIVAATIHVATVRLSIGGGRIVLGQGPWPGHGRVLDAATVTAATAVDLTWAQAFGAGLPAHRRTTRMSIRPGPALSLVLHDDEHVVITTAHPDAALCLLTTTEESP